MGGRVWIVDFRLIIDDCISHRAHRVRRGFFVVNQSFFSLYPLFSELVLNVSRNHFSINCSPARLCLYVMLISYLVSDTRPAMWKLKNCATVQLQAANSSLNFSMRERTGFSSVIDNSQAHGS